MKKVHLLHIGVGNVGRQTVKQITVQRTALKAATGLDLVFCGLFTNTAGVFKKAGLSKLDIAGFPNGSKADLKKAVTEIPLPFIVIDTTAADMTLPLLKLALKRGGSVVMSNKKPLSGSQDDFDALLKHGENRVLFETTVGAGLPVIGTLADLLKTGDDIESITGCFSGTLGYIFSQLQTGTPFSNAVKIAKSHGFTEPDPRDDLSGIDVTRKAVILARLIGQKIELSDVKLQSLYPAAMARLSVDEFMKALTELDQDIAEKVVAAKTHQKVLRYAATITPKQCSVGLENFHIDSEIGSLRGPDNIIVIRTRRYHDNPLVIKGPGAGVPVTAAGVFADIIKAAEAIPS
jgi:homoserine dehydrogenase